MTWSAERAIRISLKYFRDQKLPGTPVRYLANLINHVGNHEQREALILAFRELTDDHIAQLICDHEWIGHHAYVPGEPIEYYELCKHCGMENSGTQVE